MTLPAGFDDDVRWLLKTLVKQAGGNSPYIDGLVDETIDQIHNLLGDMTTRSGHSDHDL